MTRTAQRWRMPLRALMRLSSSSIARESLGFAISTGVIALATTLSLAVLARELTPDEFGSYAFAVAFLLFVAIFFEFGLFGPAARRMAHADKQARREIVGASLAAYLPVGAAFCLIIASLSPFVDDLFNVTAGSALLLCSPLAIGFPFALVGLMLAQGGGRLHVYSVTSAGSQLVFLGLIAIAVVGPGIVDVELPVVLRAAAVTVGGLALVLWLRPLFTRVGQNIRLLVGDAREWGFQVYVGRVLGTGTYNVDVLLVAALAGPRSVALYTIATQVTRLAGAPIVGLGSAVFARSARRPLIPRRWLNASWGYGLAVVPLLWLAAPLLIEVAFTERYVDAASLIVPLALAQAVRGVAGIYNTYLAAHAFGTELRNASLVLAASNLLFNFALIPPFGATGAAWASFLALSVNLLAHVYYYRRVQHGKARAKVADDPTVVGTELDPEL